MSSKMLAGLVAGGFGAALAIGLTLSTSFSSELAYVLALALLFGLGMLSGLLATAWLDLADYGHQPAAGAIAGLVAAGLTEICDLILRLVFASISKTSPTSMLANLVLSRMPAPSDAAYLMFLVVVNVLLYLLYLLIVTGISSAVATFAGRAKSLEALSALLEAQQRPLPRDPLAEDLVDPALLPFMRPEYSPFVPEEPPIPVPPWQQRRSRPSGSLPSEPPPLTRKSNPLPGRPTPFPGANERFPGKTTQPPVQGGQPIPRRNASGGLNPSGAPARGPTPGAGQRRSTPGMRPPPNAQWPRPRDKD
ncbi:MAG TPA: hypothetical protein VKT82_24125 [Ktedonobacterales bacterium]|nr:hypothetical protein [Ktedonobacterales bacterium]